MIPLRTLVGAMAIAALPSLGLATDVMPVTYAGDLLGVPPNQTQVIPNDGIDDTVALQAAIDHYMSAKDSVALVLPAGEIEISSTLVIDGPVGTGSCGIRIIGAGNRTSASIYEDNIDLGTIIRWTGTDGTMISIRGAIGLHMSELAIWGDDDESAPSANADIGIQIYKTSGNGAGDCIFENVSVSYCDDAVSAGYMDGETAYYGADLTFLRCQFRKSTDALSINTSTSVDFGFYDCTFNQITNVVNVVKAGGNVWLHGPLFHTCDTVFYVQDGGRNTGWLSVLNGKIDGDNVSGERLKFIKDVRSVDDTSSVRAAFRHIGSNTTQPAGSGQLTEPARLVLRGNTYVLLENCEMLCSKGPNWDSGNSYADYTGPLFDAAPSSGLQTTIHIRGCELPDDPDLVKGVIAGAGTVNYQIERCFEPNKTPFPDYDSGGWGTRDFGARSDTPSGEGEKDGDTYYDTDLGALFQYDGVREKWLSVQTFTLAFTEDALYNGSYLPMQNLTPTASEGPYVPKCTLVQASISQVGTIGTSLEWMQAGSQVGSDWVINGVTGYDTLDNSLDVDFAEGNFSPRRHSAVEMTMGNVTLTCTFRLRP